MMTYGVLDNKTEWFKGQEQLGCTLLLWTMFYDGDGAVGRFPLWRSLPSVPTLSWVNHCSEEACILRVVNR